jgi:hypothetical protein
MQVKKRRSDLHIGKFITSKPDGDIQMIVAVQARGYINARPSYNEPDHDCKQAVVARDRRKGVGTQAGTEGQAPNHGLALWRKASKCWI